MGIRSASLWLLLACVPYTSTAEGAVRLGDATYVYALGRYESAVTALEGEYLSMIESASSEERFNLYRNYNQLMGTWLQVEFLRTLLDRAVATTSPVDEDEVRSTLRDHAQFLLEELDDARGGLEENALEAQRPARSRIAEDVRSFFSNVRIMVSRLLADHCASACGVGP